MEQRPSARRRIMDAALTVFSARGYTAAGVEEIAAAAGIKAPSLYKHFKNKRAIFDAILEDMEQRGDRQEDVMRAYLLAAAEALLALVHTRKGCTNKDNAKLASQIRALTEKWKK